MDLDAKPGSNLSVDIRAGVQSVLRHLALKFFELIIVPWGWSENRPQGLSLSFCVRPYVY